jgi:peptidyl-prolyl cis-trans isomerase SurA
MHRGRRIAVCRVPTLMTQRNFRTPAAFVLGALLGSLALAQTQTSAPASPYGGSAVEEIVARVNDQVITKSDYDRGLKEMDAEAAQSGAQTMQQRAAAHKDLLRNLIDQQLWLSKGKDLGITGETELVKRLNEIRKQYNMATLEDLEKAAKEQGVSYEDFKANIRNQLITQLVMRQEVGEHLQITPGELERYYEQHKQEYTQPEGVRLSEILISADSDDAAKVAAAKTKADDMETRLRAGGDFAQLARSFSDGPTAASGGDLGQFRRNALAKVLEDATFSLKAGQYTDPILTRQGYVILKVVQHTDSGPAAYKDVRDQVEEACYMTRMEPAIRDYLNKMRDEAAITVKQGYTDTGATPGELTSSISYSAYIAPTPKKKAKVERTRFRETTHSFRQKSKTEAAAPETAPAKTETTAKKDKAKEETVEKPGKKEKIRFGQAPRTTLPPPAAKASNTEDAGAVAEEASTAQEPANPLEPVKAEKKGRFSDRARVKTAKPSAPETGTSAADAADASEVADRQTQAAPLGLNGDTSKSKKKHKENNATNGKTRLSDKDKKQETPAQPQGGDTTTPTPDAGSAAPAATSQPQK